MKLSLTRSLKFALLLVAYLSSTLSNASFLLSITRAITRSTKTKPSTVTKTEYIITPDNLKMELISSRPTRRSRSLTRPPLVFVHGSGGGAWIYNEHWLSFFARLGYDAYAVGLRGSYRTGLPPGDDSTSVKISQHTSDLKVVINSIRKRSTSPVVLGHSFGGLVLTKFLEDNSARNLVAGAVWMCSLPPSGQGKMGKRFLFTRFFHTINIIRGFAFGLANKNPAMNKLLFYDDSIPQDDLVRYMSRLQLDAKIAVNITDVEKNLPVVNNDGTAPWLEKINDNQYNLNKDRNTIFTRLVLGSIDDYIVDPPAIKETAKYAGVDPVLVQGPGHNIMLGERWKICAEVIRDWLDESFSKV